MSREEYQRALSDLLRMPRLCTAVARGEDELAAYTLTDEERCALRGVARHPGMRVNCTLYRASRLVGITRRAEHLVQELGPRFGAVFDAYLAACPDAPAEFDREAEAFARFVAREE